MTATPLYRTKAIRAIEAVAFRTEPSYAVMHRAGAAAANWLDRIAPGGGTLLFVAGNGNNGGDALVAATRLHRHGRAVQVWLFAQPDRLPPDAMQAWRDAQTAGVAIACLVPDQLPPFPARMSAIVDGLFGIGLARPITGALATLIRALNTAPVPCFALDIPSGLSADTGTTTLAICANATLTFIGAKPGLFTASGRDFAGDVSVDTLGLASLTTSVGRADAVLNDPDLFAATLPQRRHSSHKGSFGNLAVIGGDIGMAGAPLLAARAGLRLGAGRVYISLLTASPYAMDANQPEIMVHPVQQLDIPAMDALVLGPGMGQSDSARRWLIAATGKNSSARHAACVLDADALNLLASDATGIALGERDVMTPHPLEAARLLGTSVADVQGDRLAAAVRLSKQFGAVTVLKGSGTVIARPDGALVVNATGNAALATAGTGDVLAGMIGALLAQGMPTWEAALAGTWLHGAAADRLVSTGTAGLVAGEIAAAARDLLNEQLH